MVQEVLPSLNVLSHLQFFFTTHFFNQFIFTVKHIKIHFIVIQVKKFKMPQKGGPRGQGRVQFSLPRGVHKIHCKGRHTPTTLEAGS